MSISIPTILTCTPFVGYFVEKYYQAKDQNAISSMNAVFSQHIKSHVPDSQNPYFADYIVKLKKYDIIALNRPTYAICTMIRNCLSIAIAIGLMARGFFFTRTDRIASAYFVAVSIMGIKDGYDDYKKWMSKCDEWKDPQNWHHAFYEEAKKLKI